MWDTFYHDLLETGPQLGTVGISTDYVIIINHGKPPFYYLLATLLTSLLEAGAACKISTC